jgi:hypothetical protein
MTAEFSSIAIGALCLRTLGGLWGLIVGEKQTLVMSHQHFFRRSAPLKEVPNAGLTRERRWEG